MYTLMILNVLLNGWTNMVEIKLSPATESFKHITIEECTKEKEMLTKDEPNLTLECIKDKE